jgi:hypothetical protein
MHVAFKIRQACFYYKIMQAEALVVQSHNNENVRNTGQGEAQHRKYKGLKLGDGQTYGRPNV